MKSYDGGRDAETRERGAARPAAHARTTRAARHAPPATPGPARLGIDNTPPTDVTENLRRLVIVLEEVRTLLARPLIIISGYRSPALNKAIGG